jgi:hypothetical protein
VCDQLDPDLALLGRYIGGTGNRLDIRDDGFLSLTRMGQQQVSMAAGTISAGQLVLRQ